MLSKKKNSRKTVRKESLNPCFAGICSQSVFCVFMEKNGLVLILVLLEYALKGGCKKFIIFYKSSLNPCFAGICSQSPLCDASEIENTS